MRPEAGSFSLMNSADTSTGTASSALCDVARSFPSSASESRSRSVYSSTGWEVKGCAAVEDDGDKGQRQMLWCRWTAGESPACQLPKNTRTNVEQSSATFVINLTELPQRRKERIYVKVPTATWVLQLTLFRTKTN